MCTGTVFWWSDEADGWKVAMVLERMVRVREVEGAPHPAFEIKLAGKQPFRREVMPDPGETAWHAREAAATSRYAMDDGLWRYTPSGASGGAAMRVVPTPDQLTEIETAFA